MRSCAPPRRAVKEPAAGSAARAGPGYPHVPAGTGRRREAGRGRGRRRSGGRRIRSFPHVALIVRTFGHVARTRGHPIPGVAHMHIPLDPLVRPPLIHVQGIAWAPMIRPIAAYTPRAIAGVGRSGEPHSAQAHAAEDQRSRCQLKQHPLHRPNTVLFHCRDRNGQMRQTTSPSSWSI